MDRLAHDRVTLQREQHAPLAARRWLLRYLVSVGLESLRDDALLVVSELVTNAITYSSGPITLEVESDPNRLAISVADQSPALPTVANGADPLVTRGRGLQLVAAVADKWGYSLLPGGGKTVWAHLATHA